VPIAMSDDGVPAANPLSLARAVLTLDGETLAELDIRRTVDSGAEATEDDAALAADVDEASVAAHDA
jgi:hypothetical protein